MLELLGFFAFLFMGFTLGAIGAGGSIISLPIIIHLFHIPFLEATSYSLILVGVTSLIGTFANKNKVDFRKISIFALPSLITIFLFRYYIIDLIPEMIFGIDSNKILSIFLSILITYVGYILFASKKEENQKSIAESTNVKIIVTAIFTAIIMGLVGVGGGFIIVPSLMFFLKFNSKDAKSASLIIISLNSLIAFAADISSGNIVFDIKFLLLSLFISSLGIKLGIYSSSFISNNYLKRAFGIFMLLLGPLLIIKSF